jgi:hypothetical protein
VVSAVGFAGVLGNLRVAVTSGGGGAGLRPKKKLENAPVTGFLTLTAQAPRLESQPSSENQYGENERECGRFRNRVHLVVDDVVSPQSPPSLASFTGGANTKIYHRRLDGIQPIPVRILSQGPEVEVHHLARRIGRKDPGEEI